jgi:hypothetical protein
MDKHLNLHFTYKTHHLEDNVTRALLVTLQQLSPSHLRLLLRELLADTSIFDRLSGSKYLLDTSTPVEFDLQVSPQDDSKLGPDEGVILGIEYSATQDIRFDPDLADDRGGRPDARIQDRAEGFCVIIESKLGDNLYKEQIERHHATFFNTETVPNAEDVFTKTTWDKITTWLERIRASTKDAKEQFVIDQFVEYVDMLDLLEFRPFQDRDFENPGGGKFNKFLFVLAKRIQDTLGLAEYQGDDRFQFEDISRENIYWGGIDNEGVTGYVLYGCGNKERAWQFKQLIISNREGFRELMCSLQDSIDPQIRLFNKARSRFHLTRWQVDHLPLGKEPNEEQEHTYPDRFDAFCDIIGSPDLNSFERLDQRQIHKRFAEYMIEPGLDNENTHKFLTWRQPVLQYCYCDVGFHIPRALLVGKQREDLVDLFERMLTCIKAFMGEADTLMEKL